jgi:NAD(P)-dependent dehydrogenase (short-subunit alcohol dehydrogenase family)
MSKGEKARKDLLASGRISTPGKVEVWQLDMSQYSSVLAFGDRVKTLSRLDAFVANAGIDTTQFEKFEGHESTLTVNVVSTLLVALLAIPKLRESAKLQQKPSRLVLTGSVVHIFAKHKYLSEPGLGEIIKTLDDETTADMADRYNLSKLVLLLGYRKLAEEVRRSSAQEQNPVILNFVNPAWCKTELFRVDDGGIGGRIGLALIGRTAEEGSRTLVHGAVAAGEETHGKYVSECRVKPESSWAPSAESAQVEKRLWTELVGILEEIQPGVTAL